MASNRIPVRTIFSSAALCGLLIASWATRGAADWNEPCGTTADSSATAGFEYKPPFDTTRALIIFAAIPGGVERDACDPGEWPLPMGGLDDLELPTWAGSIFEDTDDLSGSWEPSSQWSLTRYFWDMSNGGHHSQRKLMLGRPYPEVVVLDSTIADYVSEYG